MIFELADRAFVELMENPQLHLPIRWDGKNFEKSLAEVLDLYLQGLINHSNDGSSYSGIEVDLPTISYICTNLQTCIQEYHKGFPSRAFNIMNRVMKELIKTPLKVYQKTGWAHPLEQDGLRLYRVRNVNSGVRYKREDIFHVPISARSMISTCRYSIAGYPSLYLTTSLELALEETAGSMEKSIVSQFKFARHQKKINIQVLELGIKPQDFCPDKYDARHENRTHRDVSSVDLVSSEVRSAYLKWFPVIAACSFIRANKSTPFASEYIIPQLLMQWVRTQFKTNRLMGIRYFSCASVRASEMGYDYVFPVHNCGYRENFCSVLRESFFLTEPVYLKEYDSIWDCENHLRNRCSADFETI